jgi:small subunit ribosomal protein S2
MPYINQRWLGGMLTNFQTISGRVSKMQEYERMRAAGDFEAMPKKEALTHTRELEKLERNLGGIRAMSKLPEAVFVIDTKKEHIAVTEANKLGLPIVAVVDTNCDPDPIDYVIPGNDDAIRSGLLMCRIVADAVDEGKLIASRRSGRVAAEAQAVVVTADAEEQARRAQQQTEARRAAALAQQEREARLAQQKAREERSAAAAAVPEPPPEAAPASEPEAAPASEPEPAPPPTAEAEPAATPEAPAPPEASTEPAGEPSTEPTGEPAEAP